MSSPLKDFFHYSKSERKGAIALLSILGIVFLYYLYIQFRPVEVTTSDAKFNVEIVKYKKGDNNYKSDSKNKYSQNKKSKSFTENKLFTFNPNEIGIDEWKKLGFSQKQSESIEKYKSAGATFKIKADLKKLFMVDEKKYQELEAFIDLPSEYQSKDYSNNKYNSTEKYEYKKTVPSNKMYFGFVLETSPKPIYDGFEKYDEKIYYHKENGKYTYIVVAGNSMEESMAVQSKYSFDNSDQLMLKSLNGYYPVKKKAESKFPKAKPIAPFDFNTADTTQLKKISGIGPSFAKRIIKYRDLLGGYRKSEQLLEVYGFTSEMFVKIKPYMLIDTSKIVKININTCEITDLKNHPYISWNVANSIIQIRKNYGQYEKVADIMKSDLINNELFSKIAPYLKAE